MIYSPHTLYKKVLLPLKNDENGMPIPSPKEEWVAVSRCRCDDDTTQDLETDNGQHYKSRYHVVYNRTDAIVEGDEVRCLWSDGRVRGEGVVGRVHSVNYLPYSELWT